MTADKVPSHGFLLVSDPVRTIVNFFSKIGFRTQRNVLLGLDLEPCGWRLRWRFLSQFNQDQSYEAIRQPQDAIRAELPAAAVSASTCNSAFVFPKN